MLRRILSFVLAGLILFGSPALPANGETADFECFFRIDTDDPEAWKKPLTNVRFLTENAYSFSPLAEKYGVDPFCQPSTEGLDTLDISGSAEFSEDQFRQLADELRGFADGKQIYIIDCRLEAHGLVNGISISWYGDHNWAYRGMTLTEVETDEKNSLMRWLEKPSLPISRRTMHRERR